MTHQESLPTASIWRALSVNAVSGVDAALAQPTQAATLIVAAIIGALALFPLPTAYLTALGLTTGVAVCFGAALGGAILGVLWFYLQGWFVQSTARLLGGRGTLKVARASIVWGFAPWILASGATILLALVDGPWFKLVIGVLAIVFALWTLVRCAQMLAHTHAFGFSRALASVMVGGVLASFVGGAALLPIFAALPQFYSIRSGSMVPGLLPSETVLASKSAYGWSRYSLPGGWGLFDGRIFGRQPNRGDIIVFKLPNDEQGDHIARVVGLPGDKIQVSHGRLIINGEMVSREPIAPYPTVDHFGKPVEAPHYVETLPGGVKHEIIQIDGDEGTFDNTRVYEVPPSRYFVLGDNRDNSVDSRLSLDQGGEGFVPYENLIGKATMILASPRPDRVGATVR